MIKTEENKIVMYFVKKLPSGVVAGLRTVIETNVLYCLIELNYSLGSMQSLHTLSDDWGVCPFYLPSEFLQLENITLTDIGQYNKSKPQLVKPFFFSIFFYLYFGFFCVCVFFLFVSFLLSSFFNICFVFFLFYFVCLFVFCFCFFAVVVLCCLMAIFGYVVIGFFSLICQLFFF